MINQDLGFETCVIGSVLLAPDRFDEVRELVGAVDFFDEVSAEFFGFLCDFDDLGKPIDDIKLVDAEVRRRKLAISAAEIAEAFSAVPNAHHAIYYAQQVAEAAKLRRLALLGNEIANRVGDTGAASAEIAEYASAKLQTIDLSSPVNIDDAAAAVAKFDIDGSQARAIDTGLYRFDRDYGGLTGGELILIGARLGTGKTAFGWQVFNHALKEGRPSLFVSCEMNTRQLMERHVASETKISPIKIRKRQFDQDELQMVEIAKERFAELPASIFVSPGCTVRQIAGAARLKRSGRGLDLIVVDYFQLMGSASKKENRRLELEEISRGLKSLAVDLDIPVIVLVQLNRQADDTIPRVAQIADTDSIARDADQVLLLHRKADSTDLRVSKHRYVADDAAIDLQYEYGKLIDTKAPWPDC